MSNARDEFYQNRRWQQKRLHILRRDGYIDQVALRDGTRIEADTVHHILPREEWPEYQWEDWNLISVNGATTHRKRLHEKYTGKLTKLGKMLAYEVAAAQGIKLKTTTLVIGLPGSGKTTYARRHMGGGIAYDLDAIAAAFRLTTPDRAQDHGAARRMAAAMRQGWIDAAHEYSTTVFVIRTAPDLKEIAETKPDKIVVCEGSHTDRGHKIDIEDCLAKIDAAVKWAQANGVDVEYIR